MTATIDRLPYRIKVPASSTTQAVCKTPALRIVLTLCIALAAVLAITGCTAGGGSWAGDRAVPENFLPEEIRTGGELAQRLDRNMDRLESEIYRPDAVFKADDWPGDFVGRTILGTVLNSRASGRAPQYLQSIIEGLPSHLNEKGYLGPVYEGKDEQQLSGHGWLLRGLCEYYTLTGDGAIIPIICGIAANLFIPDPQLYSSYPIEPQSREGYSGAESGTIQNEVAGWRLSSDIGCVFIGMGGLIHAYSILKFIPGTDPELLAGMKDCIERMLERFRETDPVAIKAQTHATLTACCALLRYYELTGEEQWLNVAEGRWKTYVAEGMTVNFENYNWFGRPDSWTEPCAIIDSYILACGLWKHTLKAGYRDLAELIYYNAICHTQRYNGGFGCDNCPSEENPYLKVHAPEAFWCCTMRGGEGLARVAEGSYLHSGKTLYIPFFRESELRTGGISLNQHTAYPFEGKVEIQILDNPGKFNRLYLPSAPWMQEMTVKLNGKACPMNGNILERRLMAGDRIEVEFGLALREEKVPVLRDGEHSDGADRVRVPFRKMIGPLIVDEELKPLYHLMDSTVWGNDYKRKILYR